MPNRPDRARMMEVRSLAQRYVKASGRVHAAIAKGIAPATLNAAAAHLGLMVEDRIIAPHDHDLAMVLDLATFEVRTDGTTAVERYRMEHPPAAGSLEERVLLAMLAARFSIFLTRLASFFHSTNSGRKTSSASCWRFSPTRRSPNCSASRRRVG